MSRSVRARMEVLEVEVEHHMGEVEVGLLHTCCGCGCAEFGYNWNMRRLRC